VTNINLAHQISHPRVFDNFHWSSHHELCHQSRGSTSYPGNATCQCWCVLSLLITAEVLTARKEEVEGRETREMDILGSLTGKGVTSIWPCCLIPRRLFCSVTGSGGESDPPEMKINQSHSRDDVGHVTNDRPSQAEAQIRACFLTIVEISMT
jgi:hypothetical protein